MNAASRLPPSLIGAVSRTGLLTRPNTLGLFAALVGLLSFQWPFVVLHPNRVTPLGEAYSLFALAGSWGRLAAGSWLLLAASALLAPGTRRSAAMALALTAAAAACLAGLTWGAAGLGADQEFSRIDLAGAAWASLVAIYAALFALHAEAPRWLALPALVLAALAYGAPYQHLGIVREYQEVADVFQREFAQHVLLVAATLPLAILAGAVIGVLAVRKPACEGVLLAVTGFLQTVPSIALFGLLLPLLSVYGKQLTVAAATAGAGALLLFAAFGAALLKRSAHPALAVLYGVVLALGALWLLPVLGVSLYALMADGGRVLADAQWSSPLAALGVRGLGTAPAMVALVLYGIWPVVVQTHAGLTSVPAAMLEAAKGMGMSARQVFWRVELPLAAPFFIGGVRGALLLLIGLATVTVLVNAGGLGYFLLRGTEQSVADLVLLGALPVAALALAADAVTRLLASLVAPRERRP